jgi:hypothetical protein
MLELKTSNGLTVFFQLTRCLSLVTVRIVCAISNRYFPALGRTVNEDDDIQLAREMQQKYYNFVLFLPIKKKIQHTSNCN